MPTRVIAHLDMDAFYASVELLRYPELRGLPVVIGGGSRHQPVWEDDPVTGERKRRFSTLRNYAGRGVVTTATYEAREFGVNSAMGMMKAAQLAPDAVLLPTDFDEYRKYSRLFKAAVRAIAPIVEDRGIDEIYIDLTELVAERLGQEPSLPRKRGFSDFDDSRSAESEGDWAASAGATGQADPLHLAEEAGESHWIPAFARTPAENTEPPTELDAWWCAREVARELKAAVKDATGLRCSIGLAPNKLIAKIASELDKPDGLTVVPAAEVALRMSALSVRKINGVGPKSAARLAQLGIRTIGELAAADPAFLRQHFGESYTHWLVAAANGRDDRPVVTHSEPKSMSRETTFDRDLHAVRDKAQLTEIFTELCLEVANDLQRKRYAAKTIGIKLRFEDFRTVTRANTLAVPTDDPAVIRRAAGECLKRVDLRKRIRLLGVRADALSPR